MFVKMYEPKDYEKIMSFLQGVHALKEIEEELFDNAVIITDEEEVYGMITYEIFRKKALIRYFVFDKDVEEKHLIEMYEKFFQNLQSKEIQKVFVIISNEVVKKMFCDLGFKEFPKDLFFLTEESILETKYKNALVLCYELN